MGYCKNCGSRLDDFDSYCSNCGAKVEAMEEKLAFEDDSFEESQSSDSARVEDSINDISDTVSQNTESFICFLLGILSLTCGTFICAIISLVFYKKALELGQDRDDEKCATFCKVGRICSIVSLVLSGVGIVLSVFCWVVPLIFGLAFGAF